MQKRKIAVIFGGQSSEHEVSRVSAQSVINNIDKSKFEVVMIGITKDGRWLKYDGPVEKLGNGEWQNIAEASLPESMNIPLGKGFGARSIFELIGAEDSNSKIDVVFPVLHGVNGEDGTIQGLFEISGIPYVGCGVLASSVGMDKAYTKIVFEKEGIPQGDFIVLSRRDVNNNMKECISKVEDRLKYPVFVKPSNAGSSVGVNKASDSEQLEKALIIAAKNDIRVLVEEFINGREVECAVLGNDQPMASTVGEIIPSNEFYDFKAKYIDNASVTKIPADLSEEKINEIRQYALRAYKCLDCAGLTRVDFFVHKETEKIYINEVNTLPGFTDISMYPKLWEESGIAYTELITRLIDLAVERFENTRRIFE